MRDLTVCGVCSDEERSAFYEQLMAAEESGKKNKKGMHSAKEAPVHHVNDVSLPGAANRYIPLRGRKEREAAYSRRTLCARLKP